MAMQQMAKEPMEGADDMAEDQAEAGQQGAGDIGEMIKNLSNGLTMVSQMIAQMPDVNPDDIQEAQDIADRFQGLISKLSGMEGGEAAPQEQDAPAGKSAPVPVKSMAGKPVSPAGV